MPEIPRKAQYRLTEVCEYADTQPYVLRFWESEFPQLNPDKTRGGQPVYSRRDLETVLRIKQLLQEEEHSIAGVRELLERENGAAPAPKAVEPVDPGKSNGGSVPAARRARTTRKREAAPPQAAAASQESLSFDTVPRERYENALDEIAHLRLELNDAESRRRRAEQSLKKLEESSDRMRQRMARARAIVQEIVQRLD